MTANYIEYNKLYAQQFCGRGLTNERITEGLEVIRKYLQDGGANFLCERFNLRVRTWERNGIVEKRRFIYADTGRELDMYEVKSIGMFLRGGPCYGK